MNEKVVILGGRERGLYLIEKFLKNNMPIHGFIVMKDDDHEIVWADKIIKILRDNSIPYKLGKSFKSPELYNFIEIIKPNLILVENWRTIIPHDIISSVNNVVVFHESLLPKYRGFAPLVWPIINGEKETGVSMFFISEKVDAGDIIDQKKISISDSDTSYDLFLKTYEVYWDLIHNNLPKLLAGKAHASEQDESNATYACMRTPDDGKINWERNTVDIYNFIRALAPPFMPGAFCIYNNLKIIIKKAEIKQNVPTFIGRIPGRIVEINRNYVSVLTGDGVLNIKTVIYDNISYNANEILNKIKLKLL